MSPTQVEVREVLRGIIDPCSVAAGCPISIEEMGLITGLEVEEDGSVAIELRVTLPGCLMGFVFHREIEGRVGALAGVRSVAVVLTGDTSWTEADISAEARRRLAEKRAQRAPIFPNHQT